MKKLIIFSFLICLFVQNIIAQCYPDRHSTDWFDAWISCQESLSPNPANKTGHWIVYDLKDRYTIDKIKVWNVNDPAHLDWGIRDFKIEYSGNYINWFDAGEFKLDKANGSPIYEGMNWINVRMPEARYVLITAISNYGKEQCYGFAEIEFSAEKTIITSDHNAANEVELKASILPNPFEDYFIANVQANLADDVEYTCLDLVGHVIQQGKIKMHKSNYMLRILTEEWPAGQYNLILRSAGKRIHLPMVKFR